MTSPRSPRPASAAPVPSRRHFLTLGVGAFVVATVPWARRRAPILTRRMLPIMGTIADVTVVHGARHGEQRRAERAIDAAFAELQHVEATMSRFLPQSEVGVANRVGAVRPVRVGHDTRDVVAAALAWAAASDGAFDPAIGRVIELWDVARRSAPPEEAPRRRLAGRHLYRAVQLATDGGRPAVFLQDPDVHLDLGGIAKGHAVDRAVDALRAWGIDDAIVNVGGDLYALGASADGAPWRVGIQAPDDPGALIGTIEVSDGAVATSGDYEQGFRYRGIRYHHLMDPETAAPRVASAHSVTVAAAKCMDADAAATAVFGMTRERACRLLQARAPGARVVTWA